jgi:hypothetical protein
MKKNYFLLLVILPLFVFSQKKQSMFRLGLKAGLNFSNITNASSINASSQTGFHAGVLLDIGSKLIGSRMELLYSKQGYDYSTDSSKGSVTHGYIVMAQMVGINITKFVQLQLGMQIGYLLSAKATSNRQSTGYASVDNILSFYNRFDYGFGGGLEVHPIAGLLVGARYSISFSNLYKNAFSGSNNGSASYSPSIDFKNNLVQLFLGYRF